MVLADRIRDRCAALGISQAELARRVGIKPQQITEIITAKTAKSKHLPRIAEELGVGVEWLTTGNEQRTIADTLEALFPVAPAPVSYRAQGELAVLGTVSAGDGRLPAGWTPALNSAISFPQHWVAVEITGNSAYPVAYPGQLALVDLNRATNTATLDDEALHDLDDNLCLIQTREEGRICAYLKRFCADRRAPAGFILASVDSGRGSPYLPPDTIDLIAPVVAVVFEDPRKPRVKGRNRAEIKTPIGIQ
jgi:transcriptional regulator with XRE-family HTH domain